jgi:heme exporter protein A
VLEGVGHAFGRRVLFRDVTLSVGGGEGLVVAGRNGAGKSTFVQVALGLLTPTRGAVALRRGEQGVARAELPVHVGLVAPYVRLYDGLTAFEHLSFVERLRGHVPDPDRHARLLDRVGLGGRGAERVRTFSSGMGQRLKFALALVHRPSILALDEPTANLDAPGAQLARALADEHRERGGILIVATNEASELDWGDARVTVGG